MCIAFDLGGGSGGPIYWRNWGNPFSHYLFPTSDVGVFLGVWSVMSNACTFSPFRSARAGTDNFPFQCLRTSVPSLSESRSERSPTREKRSRKRSNPRSSVSHSSTSSECSPSVWSFHRTRRVSWTPTELDSPPPLLLSSLRPISRVCELCLQLSTEPSSCTLPFSLCRACADVLCVASSSPLQTRISTSDLERSTHWRWKDKLRRSSSESIAWEYHTLRSSSAPCSASSRQSSFPLTFFRIDFDVFQQIPLGFDSESGRVLLLRQHGLDLWSADVDCYPQLVRKGSLSCSAS